MADVNSVAVELQSQPILDNDTIDGDYSWLSRLFFINVMAKIIKLIHYDHNYTMKQCPDVAAQYISADKIRSFQIQITKLASKSKAELVDADLGMHCIYILLKCFIKETIMLTVMIQLEMLSRCSIPIIIDRLLAEKQVQTGLMMLLLAILLLGLLLRHNNFNYAQQISLQARMILTHTLHSKIGRLNPADTKLVGLSKVITLLSKDLENMELKLQYVFVCLTTPVTVAFSLVMLIIWNGEEGTIGMFYFLSMFIVHVIINFKIKPYNIDKAAITQQRVKLFKQSVDNIRTLKMYCWQNLFRDMICHLKNSETVLLLSRYTYLVIERSFSFSSAAIASLLIFVTEYYNCRTLSVASVFATLQIFMMMRFNVMYFSQLGIDHYYELKDMFAHYLTILQVEDQVHATSSQENYINAEHNYLAVLRNASVGWSKPIISNMTLRIQRGKTYSLTGNIGQGKSTFLRFLTKEITNNEGDAEITNSVAFVEQQAFLISGTIKHNILFGRVYEATLYNQALYASCLIYDIKTLQSQDLTVIQEDGINLSGGQKARICLARALYSKKKLYLFDDVFASIDEEVTCTILDRILNTTLKNKTVILATNNLKLVKYFQYAISLQANEAVTTLRIEQNHHVETIRTKPEKELFDEQALKPQKQRIEAGKTTLWKTYGDYINYKANKLLWLLALSLFLACEVAFSIFVNNLNYLFSNDTWNQYSIITILLGISLLPLYFLKYYCLVYLVLSTNNAIHNNVYLKLLRSKLGYFETHHKSDLINKFGLDISTIDMNLPMIACDSMEAPLYFTNLVITICIKVPLFGVMIPFMVLGIYYLYTLCASIMQKCKVLDMQSKAPIINSFNLMINGNSQIRCYRQQDYFNTQFHNNMRNMYRANTFYWNVFRAFGFYVQAITLVFSMAAIVLSYTYGWDRSRGQQLIYSIALSDYIQFGIRQISTMDGMMMSVQRLLKFHHNQTEQEDPDNLQDDQLNNSSVNIKQENWPASGTIQYRNVNLVYQNGKQALKNVSLLIKHGEKAGCVGRTGSGKTSLLNALFRFESDIGGQILIDDIDIKDVKISKLRQIFSVIPQTPFVFTGSIRKNLDPYDEHSQQMLNNVLQVVCLQQLVGKINEKSTYLTSSQKQLICLARCLLKSPKSKIVILDEATSSVDAHTDQVIQNVISKHFQHTTILSIAHRISTIADSQIVIEMCNGQATLRDLDSI